MKLNIFLLFVGLLGTACERHSASTLPGHGAHDAHGAKPEVSQPAKPAQPAPAPAPANAPAPKFFEESGKK
jgi:hypothetical protein